MSEPTVSEDIQPVPHAQLNDLDVPLVLQHIATAKKRGRYTGASDPLAYLRRYPGITEVAGTPVPTLRLDTREKSVK